MSRNSVLRGSPVELTALFLDAAGDPVDPTNLKVSIYPPGSDPRLEDVTTDDAWVYDVTLTDPGSGPLVDASETIEKVAVGSYKYTFTPPADADLGAAFDNWEATIDLVNLDETFTFTIVGGGSVGTTQLYENNILFLKLDSSIASADGYTLAEDYEWYITTTYNPLYSSVRRLRLELGPLLKDVPDDTINLAIFEASLEANAITFGDTLEPDDRTYFNFSRRMFVTCLAEVILLGSIMGSGGGAKSKRLADLAVDYKDNVADLLNKALACMAKYEDVLTSGGNVAQGTSLKPDYVIKGQDDPDRPPAGRGWEPTSSYMGSEVQMPAANTRSQYTWKRRGQRDFSWPSRWKSFWRDD